MERAVGAEGRPLGSLEGKGGEGGIRTHGTLTGTPVFKTGAINRSTTSPLCPCGGGQDGVEGREGKLKSGGWAWEADETVGLWFLGEAEAEEAAGL